MPLMMQRIYNIVGNYTDQEKEAYKAIIDDFRIFVFDDDPEKNILNKKTAQYSDNKIVRLVNMAVRDINGGSPPSNMSAYELWRDGDSNLILYGTVVFAMIGEGVLQLRNQMDYSDSGLSLALFNKTGLYQSWAGFFLQQYMEEKKDFKSGLLPKSPNSGFVGISSEFGYRWY